MLFFLFQDEPHQTSMLLDGDNFQFFCILMSYASIHHCKKKQRAAVKGAPTSGICLESDFCVGSNSSKLISFPTLCWNYNYTVRACWSSTILDRCNYIWCPDAFYSLIGLRLHAGQTHLHKVRSCFILCFLFNAYVIFA